MPENVALRIRCHAALPGTARSIGDKGNRVDLDQCPLEKASDLHGRACRQISLEALTAHAVIFAILVQARQPRRNANDVLERAPDSAERLLDPVEAPVRLLGHRAAGNKVSRYVHRSARTGDRHRLAEAGASGAGNTLYAHVCSVLLAL